MINLRLNLDEAKLLLTPLNGQSLVSAEWR